MKVKGTWMVDLVKLLRAAKDKDFSKYLTKEDFVVLNSKILPSQWYPFETYKRLGLAVFKVIGNSQLTASRAFGRMNMANLLKIYGNIMIPGDPAATVEKFAALAGNFFQGIGTGYRVVERGPKSIKIKIVIDEKDDLGETAILFPHQISGNVEELLIQSGAKNHRLELEKVADGSILTATWD
jgi:hypothetical protein